MISEDKPKNNSQDIICHKCKKPGHYASQCQLMRSATKGCSYCGSHGHTEVACYKKQADEAISIADKERTKNDFPKTILEKEVEPEAEKKKKTIMFVQEIDVERNTRGIQSQRATTSNV